MKAIQHEKLIYEDYYCESVEGYDFSKCATEKITSGVGCRSFLSNGTDTNVCQDLGQYLNLMAEYQKITDLEKNELVNNTQCYFPCNYMEYKVRIVRARMQFRKPSKPLIVKVPTTKFTHKEGGCFV